MPYGQRDGSLVKKVWSCTPSNLNVCPHGAVLNYAYKQLHNRLLSETGHVVSCAGNNAEEVYVPIYFAPTYEYRKYVQNRIQ